MSGNTIISYYLSTILGMIGYNTTYAKTRINMSSQCWNLITATLAALIVPRFPRRKMFLLCISSMLLVFIGLTVSTEQVIHANAEKKNSNSAAIAALFFIYAYAPAYNIGNNALTYTYLIELFPFAEVRSISLFPPSLRPVVLKRSLGLAF
jgi:MFS family permease